MAGGALGIFDMVASWVLEGGTLIGLADGRQSACSEPWDGEAIAKARRFESTTYHHGSKGSDVKIRLDVGGLGFRCLPRHGVYEP